MWHAAQDSIVQRHSVARRPNRPDRPPNRPQPRDSPLAAPASRRPTPGAPPGRREHPSRARLTARPHARSSPTAPTPDHTRRPPDRTPKPPALTRSIRLRPWQKAALERYDATAGPDFLAVATPGAGKTTFALTAAVGQMTMANGPRRLIVVAPTAHLKRQWAAAAAAFGLHLDPAWVAADGALPADMHGIVTTYQQVAGNAAVLR
ncbi:MAG: DEAD/DEAH box helicase family protein, partial [Actinomycetota bacterium]|nr:DEAD/DEAH box helicase family protein [Actinomycetota bacterium]